jgi:surfeit locus 1 family protein
MAFLARLGIWQLDRRDQRRAANAELSAQLAQPPLLLDDAPLPAEPAALRDRLATARGRFDYERQIALTDQSWRGQPGFHLLAPLVLADGRTAVLVDRGWLPLDEEDPARWAAFDEPGLAVITGTMQLTQPPRVATADEESGPRQAWYRVDIKAIGRQMPYELLAVYLRQSPAGGGDSLPYREAPAVDLSEGPHLGYAIQWFLFAAILGVGYIGYVARQRPSSSAGGKSD